MPGLLCDGAALKTADLRDSKAYCEGMAYRSSGTVLSVPVTDNPHVADSDAGVAWIAGWDAADTITLGGVIPASLAGCCALRGVVVPV